MGNDKVEYVFSYYLPKKGGMIISAHRIRRLCGYSLTEDYLTSKNNSNKIAAVIHNDTIYVRIKDLIVDMRLINNEKTNLN